MLLIIPLPLTLSLSPEGKGEFCSASGRFGICGRFGIKLPTWGKLACQGQSVFDLDSDEGSYGCLCHIDGQEYQTSHQKGVLKGARPACYQIKVEVKVDHSGQVNEDQSSKHFQEYVQKARRGGFLSQNPNGVGGEHKSDYITKTGLKDTTRSGATSEDGQTRQSQTEIDELT